jgi:hypothetical protein
MQANASLLRIYDATSSRRRGRHAGSGIAATIRTDSTVRVTTRQSDSDPIASEAAVKFLIREAASAARLPNPSVAGDRRMVECP